MAKERRGVTLEPTGSFRPRCSFCKEDARGRLQFRADKEASAFYLCRTHLVQLHACLEVAPVFWTDLAQEPEPKPKTCCVGTHPMNAWCTRCGGCGACDDCCPNCNDID